jgi:hypothetical protein
MAAPLIDAFLEAKIGDAKASVALYAVSSDVDGASIAKDVALRSNKAIVDMSISAPESLQKDPQLLASMLQATYLEGCSGNR